MPRLSLRTLRDAALAAALSACTAPEPAPVPLADDEAAACFALAHSPASRWPLTLPPVLALGERASGELARLLAEAPHAPGAPAVAAALGRVTGDEASRAALVAVVQTADEAVACEAALALGRRRDAPALPALRAAMADPARPPLVRAAAGAAILGVLGRDAAAIDFLCDLLLAGTAEGRARGMALGLPVDRPRWALERSIAIEALGSIAGDHDLRLDADASWPRLAAAVRAARTHFGLEPR